MVTRGVAGNHRAKPWRLRTATWTSTSQQHSRTPGLVAVAYLLCPHVGLEDYFACPRPSGHQNLWKRRHYHGCWGNPGCSAGLGLSATRRSPTHYSMSYLLLKNRSPMLDHLTLGLLKAADQECPLTVSRYFFQVSRALQALGIVPSALPGPGVPAKTYRTSDMSIPKDWLDWCDRWRSQTTLQRPENGYYALLMAGRWLGSPSGHHKPSQWTYDVAAEFVAAVSHVKVGDWANPALRERRTSPERLGQPLRPQAKHRLLGSMRTFFRTVRNGAGFQFSSTQIEHYELLPLFDGYWDQILGSSIKTCGRRFCGQPSIFTWRISQYGAMEMSFHPIRLSWFGRLLWSGALRLCGRTRFDGCGYDVFAGNMKMSWFQRPARCCPNDATCFLDVPVNKTSTAYTKPVHPLVGKRINEWERVRPEAQPREMTTRPANQFTFSFHFEECASGRLHQ